MQKTAIVPQNGNVKLKVCLVLGNFNSL